MKPYMAKNDITVKSQVALLCTLDIQMGQLGTDKKSRLYGVLTNDTKVPMRDDKEKCKALTLRSMKVLPLRHLDAQKTQNETI